MIVFPVQIYYNYGYKEPFFVTFYIFEIMICMVQ